MFFAKKRYLYGTTFCLFFPWGTTFWLLFFLHDGVSTPVLSPMSPRNVVLVFRVFFVVYTRFQFEVWLA